MIEAYEFGFVLVFEGYNLGYTTTSDFTGIEAAWDAASEWSDIRGGLGLIGDIEHSAYPFDSQVQMPGMSFTIVDADDTITALMLHEASTTALMDGVRPGIDSDDAAILLDGTNIIPGTSTIYIGTEELTVAANDGAGHLAGVVRGIRAIWGKDSDPNRFGQPHPTDSDLGYFPTASSEPRQWIGRAVALYLCRKDTNGTWTARGTGAECVWAGRIQSIGDDGTGKLQLQCSSILEKLKGTLLSKQYTGVLEDGAYLTEADGYFSVTTSESIAGVTTTASEGTSIIASAGLYNAAQIVDLINAQLLAWFNNSPGTYFPTSQFLTINKGARDGADGNITWTFYDYAGSLDQYTATIALSANVWYLLGWNEEGSTASNSAGKTILSRGMIGIFFESTTIIAPSPPRRIVPGSAADDSIIIVRESDSGTEYVSQPTIPAGFPATTTGFIRIGGKFIFAVYESATNQFTVTASLGPVWSEIVPGGVLTGSRRDYHLALAQLEEGASTDGVSVEQVWIETGRTGEMFLELMTSTGTAAYNHATYDVYPLQMCLGMPWDMVDGNSILGIGDEPYLLFMDKPTSFLKLFESVLQVRNLHSCWRNGQLGVDGFGETAPTDFNILELTEDNKAMQLADGQAIGPVIERSVVMRTMDNLINRVTLKFNQLLGKSEFARTITINNVASQGDLGQVKAQVVEGIGIYEDIYLLGGGALNAWISRMAASALAYFGRPLGVVQRSYDVSLLSDVYPGRRVKLTDSGIVSPVTGTRGVVDLLAWVVESSFDYSSGVGTATLIFAPELSSGHFGLMSPSAKVDPTLGASNGYTSATKTLYLMDHEYSATSQIVDGAWFPAGSKIRVIPLDDTGATVYTDTVASQSGSSELVLTTGLAAFPASGTYVVEFDSVSNVITAQRDGYAFIADDATNSTGYAANDAYIYGGQRETYISDDVGYTDKYCRMLATSDDTGQAYSVHKLHETLDWCNTALAHHTAQPVLCSLFSSAIFPAIGSTTNWSLLMNPVWVPLYGGARQLLVQVYASTNHASDTGQIRVRATTGLVRGTGDDGLGTLWSTTAEPLRFTPGYLTTFTLAAGTGYTYSAEQTLDPMVMPGDPPGCWITVDALASGAGIVRLRGLFIREAPLT